MNVVRNPALHEWGTLSMRSIIVAFIVATLSVLASPGWTASQRDYDDCNQTKDLNQRVAGCTRVIEESRPAIALKPTTGAESAGMSKVIPTVP